MQLNEIKDVFEGEGTTPIGYQDGFAGKPAKYPDDKEYMTGFRIGRSDRSDRREHLNNKQGNGQ